MDPFMTPISPTPQIVYEPRIWCARVWVQHGPFEGIPVVFKAPYGQGMVAATILARACSRHQILRFSFGPASARQMRRLDRKTLQRFEAAFTKVAKEWSLDWAA
jgi:hypothetical protein